MTQTFPIRRGFLIVDGREVHYRALGSGPPALFIHSSPTNSCYVLPDMQAQGARYTCFAFDTPGFGLSDPLPLAEMRVADLADATAAAMRALGLPPLPVFGTHSGAAIALELGYRHPALVTGLMLDGVPIFTREEVAPLEGDGYFAPLVIDRLGGHYASTWTRFHDQSVWFPWCDPSPEHINEYDLAAPEVTHRWTEMFFAAAAHYKPAYWAATCYCEDAITAAAALTLQAVFTASEADMLYPHLQRLPPLRANQAIVEIGNDNARKRTLTAEGFARFGSVGVAPETALAVDSSDTVHRQFAMDGERPILFRTLGDRTGPAILLLHDIPGAGAMIVDEMAAMAEHAFVILPDLPGSGDSEALGDGADLGEYAQALWRLCDAIGVAEVTLHGLGLSASLAVAMAAQEPRRCVGVRIDGLYLPDDEERAEMLAHYAPPIIVQPDGAHWYRLWMMLRDSRIYWPWYDTRRVSLRRLPESFDEDELHRWAVEVMKQYGGYHRLIDAVLDYDAAERLATLGAGMVTLLPPATPVGHAHAARLAPLSRV